MLHPDKISLFGFQHEGCGKKRERCIAFRMRETDILGWYLKAITLGLDEFQVFELESNLLIFGTERYDDPGAIAIMIPYDHRHAPIKFGPVDESSDCCWSAPPALLISSASAFNQLYLFDCIGSQGLHSFVTRHSIFSFSYQIKIYC